MARFQDIYSHRVDIFDRATSVKISGIEMTIPDGSCKIELPESNSLGYIKEKKIDISNFFSEEDFRALRSGVVLVSLLLTLDIFHTLF